MGAIKTFGDLKPENQDKVYLIDPSNGSIKETKVFSSRELKRNGRQAVLEIEIFKITNLVSIKEDDMVKAKETFNTSITWKFRVMNYTTIAILPLGKNKNKDFTVISSDEQNLRTWMTKTGPQRRRIIY